MTEYFSFLFKKSLFYLQVEEQVNYMEDKYRMSTRSEKDRSKQIQDKCQSLLTQMLRDEDNKYCVDCDAKG